MKQLASVRILTLGIGSYCNWFFLKMLSQIGRGYRYWIGLDTNGFAYETA